MRVDNESIKGLVSASDAELYSLLGVYSVGILCGPDTILENGREGLFWQSKPTLLGEEKHDSFRHQTFQSFGMEFLRTWTNELQKAICQNGQLRQQFKGKTHREIDLMVAAVVGSIAAHLPQLASLTGLLIVLGVLVARSGLDAFCKTLEELSKPKK
jgi:hypothetical protein